ncbi:unnamed protein product [Ectocarpus sp. 12 AP-2014]
MASAAADSAKADREVLLQFFRLTGGESWTHQEGWAKHADDLDGWYGVTTNAEGRVVKLELRRERGRFGINSPVPYRRSLVDSVLLRCWILAPTSFPVSYRRSLAASLLFGC